MAGSHEVTGSIPVRSTKSSQAGVRTGLFFCLRRLSPIARGWAVNLVVESIISAPEPTPPP